MTCWYRCHNCNIHVLLCLSTNTYPSIEIPIQDIHHCREYSWIYMQLYRYIYLWPTSIIGLGVTVVMLPRSPGKVCCKIRIVSCTRVASARSLSRAADDDRDWPIHVDIQEDDDSNYIVSTSLVMYWQMNDMMTSHAYTVSTEIRSQDAAMFLEQCLRHFVMRRMRMRIECEDDIPINMPHEHQSVVHNTFICLPRKEGGRRMGEGSITRVW